MISQKMIDWGSQGCGIREIAAYGEARAAVVGAENVFNFTIGNPSVKAPDCVARSIRHLLDTVPPEVLHGYTPAPGFYAVRQAMAEQLTKSFRTPYRAEDIFMTSGACAALAIICAALIGPGEEVVTLTPYFSEYRVYVEAVGGRLVEAPSDPETFQIDLAAVEAALSPRTALVLLNSPNNPSGVVLERSGLEALAALLRRKAAEYGHPIYIVADEPYRALVYGGVEVPFIPDLYADTVYCTSFSKSLSLAGERVGYLAVAEQVAEHDRLLAAIAGACRVLGYINVSSMYQLVAAECAGETADLSIYETNRDYLYRSLTELGYQCVRPDGAFYLFLKTPEGWHRRAMECDLLLVPGEEFSCPGYARLAYCVPLERLERAMPKFAALAEEFGLKK